MDGKSVRPTPHGTESYITNVDMHKYSNHLTVPRSNYKLRHAVEGRHPRQASARRIARGRRGRAASRTSHARTLAVGPVRHSGGFRLRRRDDVQTWIFDGVGNRTSETNAGVADSYTPDRFRSRRERVRGRPSPAANNKLQSIVRNAATVRSFTPDRLRSRERVRGRLYGNAGNAGSFRVAPATRSGAGKRPACALGSSTTTPRIAFSFRSTGDKRGWCRALMRTEPGALARLRNECRAA